MPKVIRKLTEKEIQAAKPQEKPYKLYDEGGLLLLVRPSGTKVWQYPYKLNDKYNVLTIGQYGSTPDKVGTSHARKLRDEAKALLKQGIDPNKQKKDVYQQKVSENANTFEAVAREWYGKQNWAPKHSKNILSRMEKDVFGAIGWKPIAEVNVPDIMSILRRIEERGAPDVAKRINQYCSAVFEHAIVQGLCDMNPAQGRAKYIQGNKVQNRAHLTEKQLPAFLQRLEDPDNHSLMTLAVKLLVLTFVRPGELRGAAWEEINEKEKLWVIPASRMKIARDHIAPLSKQALKTITQIREISGDSTLLFPGRKRVVQPISDVALIKAVKHLTNDKATPHGFRHTASTILNEQGFNRDHIEMQLAHVEQSKVRGTYNKAIYLEDRKVMMQAWANFLDKKRKEANE
jgi:integrase